MLPKSVQYPLDSKNKKNPDHLLSLFYRAKRRWEGYNITLVINKLQLLKIVATHYLKSQTFVQKFNFDKIPTFSRVFHPTFFWQYFSWNQSCQQLKSPKPQHFHEFFTPKNRQFSLEIKVEFLDKNLTFRIVCSLRSLTFGACKGSWVLCKGAYIKNGTEELWFSIISTALLA